MSFSVLQPFSLLLGHTRFVELCRSSIFLLKPCCFFLHSRISAKYQCLANWQGQKSLLKSSFPTVATLHMSSKEQKWLVGSRIHKSSLCQ